MTKTTTKTKQARCSTPGCRRPRYGGWPVCEKCLHSQTRAAMQAAAPGLTIKFWSPRNCDRVNLRPTLSRAYVTLDGQDVGYVESRLHARKPRGYIEQHRWCKGEDIADETIRSTLPPEVEKMLLDALEAAGANRSLGRVFVEGGYLVD